MWKQLCVVSYILIVGPACCLRTTFPVVWEASNIPVVNTATVFTFRALLHNPCTYFQTTGKPIISASANANCQKSYETILEQFESWNQIRPNFATFNEHVSKVSSHVSLVPGLANTTVIHRHDSSNRTIVEESDQRFIFLSNGNAYFGIPLKIMWNVEKLLGGGRHGVANLTRNFFVLAEQIERVKSFWERGVIIQDLFSIFDTSPPCQNDLCPLELAKPIEFEYSVEHNTIVFTVSLPTISSKLVAMRAVSFDMLLRRKSTTCRASYKGPTLMIMSKSKHCQVNHNITTLNLEDKYFPYIGVTTDYQCEPPSMPKNHFQLVDCKDEPVVNASSFVKTAYVNDQFYIYCAYSTIKIEGIEQNCPNNVIVIPSSVNVSVNNGSRLMRSTANSSLSNWILHGSAEHELPLFLEFSDKDFFAHRRHSNTRISISLREVLICTFIICSLVLIYSVVLWHYRRRTSSPLELLLI